jgi:hypothetical protein
MTEAEMIADFAEHMRSEAKHRGYDNKTIVFGLLTFLAAYTCKLSSESRNELIDVFVEMEKQTKKWMDKQINEAKTSV